MLGPPGNCRVELLKFDNEYKLLVVSGFIPAPALMGLPDFDIALFSSGKVSSNSLLAKIKSKLGESPLALSVDPRRANLPVLGPTESIIGVARHRRSPILPLWEWITVRVDLYTPRVHSSLKGSSGRVYTSQSEIQVSLTLLLSPRNTPEYRIPQDVEFTQYLDVVKASIGLALEEVCQRAEWLDGRTLACDAL